MYQHILLAIHDCTHSEKIARKAKTLADTYGANLSLIHVLDNIPMPDTAYGTVISLHEHSDNVLLEIEKAKFINVAKDFQINIEQCYLIWGIAKQEIIHLAKQKQVDLIIIGSHEKHGLALLLGSTTDGILHHSHCDVLAVHLRD